MINSNKLITVLVLVCLLTTVIGSWLILGQIARVSAMNAAAPTHIIVHYTDSGKAMVTILAPSGTRNIASAGATLDVTTVNT